MSQVESNAIPREELMRWSQERFMALVESGVIDEGRGIELIDGQVVEELPQGPLHRFIYIALQRVFSGLDAFNQGLEANTTVLLAGENVFDPEFALLRPEARGRYSLPQGEDVLWAIEVSVTTVRKDLGAKAAVYARSGVPHYWVFDGTRRGVWIFSDPQAGEYGHRIFVTAEETVPMPILHASLTLSPLFPTLDLEG